MVTFDTHAAVERLKHGGLQQTQAEAVVDVVRDVTGELVTKADLAPLATKADLDSRISSLEARLTWRIVLALGAYTALLGAFAAVVRLIP